MIKNILCASAVAAALSWMSVVERIQAADSLSTHFPKEHESGDYLGALTDNSAGSGVTFRPAQSASEQDAILILDNSPQQIRQFSRTDGYQRTITLSGFGDPEDIHWISGNTYVISQEENTSSTDELVVIDIAYSTNNLTVYITNAIRRLQINNASFVSSGNKGIEAVALIGTNFYFTTEIAPSSPANSWKVWRTPNAGSGTVSVSPVAMFSIPTWLTNVAADLSGLATDGTDLWLLSHEGPTNDIGRVVRVTTAGDLIADYTMPTFTNNTWQQPEGIEVYTDPADNLLKILLTGEVGGGGGVDFMRLKVPTVSIAANDPTGSETCLDPGVFRVTRSAVNTGSSLTVYYSVNGTAVNGSDYSTLSGSVTITSGATSATITVTPISATPGESAETVILNLTTNAAYVIASPSSATVTITEGDSYDWEPQDDGTGGRVAHSTVLTSTEVIVWGGGIDGVFLDDGARFNLAAGTWSAISTSNAPAGRWWHAAVWTGAEMIIWGGRPAFFSEYHYHDGAAYNPATDSWRSISTNGAPTGRSQMAVVWTGTEMIVWGGHSDGMDERDDGGAYDPSTDTWTTLASTTLDGRVEPSAVWTGTEMIVFGGLKVDNYLGDEVWTSFGDGARYNPATDSWSTLNSSGAPSSRTAHTAVWTGTEMLVWGGRYLPDYTFLNTGARYNPATDSWTAILTNSAPTARVAHAAVWTGTRMIVWGGYIDESGTPLATGGEYSPSCNTWTATASTDAPAARFFAGPNDSAIWTPYGMFIYGGWDYPYSLNSTALYRRTP